MDLFTLGCSVTHAAYSARTARSIITALDPDEFPVLSSHIDVVADSTIERDVFRIGLRNLIYAAETVAPHRRRAKAPDTVPLRRITTRGIRSRLKSSASKSATEEDAFWIAFLRGCGPED